MRGETQALHLAKMMKNYIGTSTYELALPLVSVRSSKLKKLSVKDVLLLDMEVLAFVLINGDSICAELILKNVSGSNVIEITKVDTGMVVASDSNKYKNIKFSFGKCMMKDLLVGNNLDIVGFDLNIVTLILNDKKIAEGSLVNIDNKIAVKINKVMQ